MGLIIQTSALSQTVLAATSGEFLNQIEISGGSGVVTFSTTGGSKSMVCTSTGLIETTGSLLPASYVISGTMADAHSNSGTWKFTLTVVEEISANLTVQPIIPTLPSGTEISVPFQIDPCTGTVASVSDYYTIYNQHIAAIVMTMVGERVMLPLYGTPLQSALFGLNDAATWALLSDDISKAIKAWQPEVNVLGVFVDSGPGDPALMSVTINYSVLPSNDVNRLTMTTGGTVTQVVTP